MKQEKNYPNSDTFERAYLLTLLYNKEIQGKYLSTALPAIFLDRKKRAILYLMQQLKEMGKEINIDNIILEFIEDKSAMQSFFRKHKLLYIDKYRNIKWLVKFDEDEINKILTDPIDTSGEHFDIIHQSLYQYAFSRFANDRGEDILNHASYAYGEHIGQIASNAKAIITVHDMLFNPHTENKSVLSGAREQANNRDSRIITSSQAINQYIGGFSRGYITSVIAKSSHCKSTWVDFNAVYCLLTDKCKRVDIITPEEDKETRWIRIMALINKVNLTDLKFGRTSITLEHEQKTDELLGDKLFIWDKYTKPSEILSLMEKLESDMIILDHLQSIDYPGTGNYLSRMIGGIPGFVDRQKRIVKKKRNVMIDLSQVNDKEIQRSDRLIKAPRYWDAYGNSVLYQASREFLALWYPYKDYEDAGAVYDSRNYGINDVIVSVEKNSFGQIGKAHLYYEPNFAMFKDKDKGKGGDKPSPNQMSFL